jgi:hypothetical protein
MKLDYQSIDRAPEMLKGGGGVCFRLKLAVLFES